MDKKYEIGEIIEYEMMGGNKPVYGARIVGVKSDNDSDSRAFTLLAKDRRGIKNIYKLLDLSHGDELLKNKYTGTVSYEEIRNNREGVIIGLECTKSDLYQVWTDDEQDHEGEQTDLLIAEEYDIADYVEIQPWKSYTGMMGDLANVLYPEEVAIKWLLNEMVDSLKAFNKYAVAASVISKEPVITTEDLMDEYSQPEEYREKFFGPEMARKIVVDNPKIIGDMIENISIEDVIYAHEKKEFRKQLKGKKITEEGVRRFNDALNKYGGLVDEPTVTDIYLDIDGTIKGTAAPLEDVIAFIEYCLDNYDVFWLTTHCKNGVNRTYEALGFLPEDLRKRAYREIGETDWNELKTDAIDFAYGFVWFDDTVMQAELEVLSENDADMGFFKIESDNPMCMKDALDYLIHFESEI